ncbi:hypothetical protein N0V90_007855 [Kalmusia sp. IMI 367209]|nr:hypothetical protein N0V90_007855 [Kalmusia sp. IMI 367209]
MWTQLPSIAEIKSEYKIRVVNIAYLAIPLFRVPDVKDSKAQLPPSQQGPVAAGILRACSAAKDLTSTLQILNAVYYSSNGFDIPQAVDIARLFTANDISDCKKMLAQLAEEGNAHAMTLHGRFLEQSGKTQEARDLYVKALEKYDTKIHRGYPHPMALPWLTPWMALVNLQTANTTSESISKVKEALEFGALKADDPMAYYRLANLQEPKSHNWLAYMSKAAASGHSDAMYRLGQFYLDVHADPSGFLNHAKFRSALKFMTSWRQTGALNFAKEWFNAAAIGGHKPSILQLVDLYGGDKEKQRVYLRAMLEDPPKGVKEEWPHLVMQARKRLAEM